LTNRTETPIIKIQAKEVIVSTQLIKQILCPVDFSRSSIDAFNYAASFANKLGAKITARFKDL